MMCKSTPFAGARITRSGAAGTMSSKRFTVLDSAKTLGRAMDAKQTKIVLAVAAIVAVLWLALPLMGTRGQPGSPTEPISLAFDPSGAFQGTRDFVTEYPRRVLGSIESRQSTGFLQQHFRQLGYQVSYAHFDAVIAGYRQVGRNVYAFRRGRSPEILALIAHYDTARTTLQGAMDDGSGVGILMELARVFAGVPTNRSLLFVASDGEEWGMLGALDLVRNYPERQLIVAALSLDYVTVGDLATLTLETSGQRGGYSPPWLRSLARVSAEAEGVAVSGPAGFREFVQRALLLSSTDQGPLLFAGIPAINLGSESRDEALERSVYHSDRDTMENLKVESFAKYGRVAERMVRSLDSLPLIPHEPMGAFRVHGDTTVSPRIMALLQYLAFAPLVVALWFHVANHGRYFSLGRIQREVSALLGTFFPFAVFYSSIVLLTLLRRFPLFSMYPATPKDPILQHPQYGVLAGIFITVALFAVGCYFLVWYLNNELPRADFFVSKTLLLLVLAVVSIWALVYNGYWAVTFFVLPAWIWALIGAGAGPGARAANRMLIVAAGVIYYALSLSYAARLYLGWRLIWYEVLALSTGMFRFRAFLLAAAIFTLGIRFLAIQSYCRESRTE